RGRREERPVAMWLKLSKAGASYHVRGGEPSDRSGPREALTWAARCLRGLSRPSDLSNQGNHAGIRIALNALTMTGADELIETLQIWGVRVVFGLPGDGINGLMEALRRKQDVIRFVQVRHEESAAFMACAYAKYTGRLGVCLATSGPGG